MKNKSQGLTLNTIIIAALVLIVLVILVLIFTGRLGVYREASCNKDSDCAPAQCCHPTSCVHKSEAPDCEETYCTLECRPDTMDCGGGQCMCMKDGKCDVLWIE